jgi:hypothetical protein
MLMKKLIAVMAVGAVAVLGAGCGGHRYANGGNCNKDGTATQAPAAAPSAPAPVTP